MRDVLSVDGGLALERVQTAADGTRKLVFTLTAGPAAGAAVETVLIPVVRRGGSRPRVTVCVSSQVGCAMNCQFCYTGRMGLRCEVACHSYNASRCQTHVSAASYLLLTVFPNANTCPHHLV